VDLAELRSDEVQAHRVQRIAIDLHVVDGTGNLQMPMVLARGLGAWSRSKGRGLRETWQPRDPVACPLRQLLILFGRAPHRATTGSCGVAGRRITGRASPCCRWAAGRSPST
jgi:hypothetical protein